MSQPTRTCLHSVLVGDELGQIKLIQLDPHQHHKCPPGSPTRDHRLLDQIDHLSVLEEYDATDKIKESDLRASDRCCSTLDKHHHVNYKHRIVRILDDCLQSEPAASRAITNIRPIEGIQESRLDTTDKPNHLFLITNKVGQIFVCNTDSVRDRLGICSSHGTNLATRDSHYGYDDGENLSPILSPIYYNMNSKVPVCGSQPINQTNILVIYKNGDIQHVNIGQDILQSSLKIKRKAIRMLGLGYNSDARAIHWRIDGSSGICYYNSDAASAHLDENDPLTDIVLSSPTHKICKRDRSQQKQYNKSPCIKSRKYNELDRLVPTQVINMITARADQYKPSSRTCKWTSITSLNLIYRKLALYDLVGSENFERSSDKPSFEVNGYKLNENLLALGGHRYTARVYDVQTQKPIYNCRTGASGNPLPSSKGDPSMIGDIEWLGGNKTTKKSPSMLATCTGVDSIVNVYDIRSPRPVFHIDLTYQTENKWEPYDNHSRGCMFTRICASGAPYSTAVPSQQLALGSTNGQLHIIDLRFVAKSNRTLGRLSGFCGGSIREIRFVSESFETSKMISCATDRFVRIHKIQTSFTSVISQKLATKVFMGTKPTSIQPVCDELTQSYLASVVSRCGSESHISTAGSGGWSIL